MRKYLLLLSLLISIDIVAQNDSTSKSNFLLKITLKNHLPINVFKRNYSYGIGGALNSELKISNNLAFIFTPAYMRYFFNQKVNGISGSTGYLIIPGGLKYYMDNKIYVFAEAGIGVKTSKFGKESVFEYSAGAGFCIAKNIDASLEYSKGNGSTFAPENIGINLAYTFYMNRQFNKAAK
jgi:hypothetical protein